MVQTSTLTLLATMMASACANRLTLSCPSTNASSACVMNANGTATPIAINMNSIESLNATKKSIDTVDCQTLQASKFTRLNLSYNALSSMENLLCLPSSLQVLDVSYNQLTAMENINWNSFPNLTTLILRGNAIASMRNTSFPPTLTTLDLSNNPLASVVLSKATYTQLNALPSLSMHTTTQHVDLLLKNFQFNGCSVQDIKYLGENVVCIETEPTVKSTLGSTLGYLAILVVIFAILIGAAVYVSKRRNQRQVQTPMEQRDTWTSECCEDLESARRVVVETPLPKL
ncbi:unnamed protein product [Aphanomyces euteiches]|uniref:Leucine-rich repeat-containing N-terminal plant-type domain-containing protein n=1 Tax=Aphanomyces euteiches TaxID=100861 RepID=A0A6G0WLA4_9STRA|nr:hypothetical protein Ae201684_013923 [Aphanomyces euteiches]KAH9083054.1 hypothetical protein Ae201684P_013955 [Aphanomyces euteiches]KAH9133498.1 hypothetical protein AeRB84_020437 [Aphanomyces euteiches]